MQQCKRLVNKSKTFFPRLVIIHETQRQQSVTSDYLNLPYFWSANWLCSNIYNNEFLALLENSLVMIYISLKQFDTAGIRK